MNVEACKITHNGKAGKVFLILQITLSQGASSISRASTERAGTCTFT